MKKLIFCLLCFCLMTFGSSAKIIEVAPAGAWGIGIIGSGGGGDVSVPAACVGDSSSELCEDFDSSTSCFAAYSSNCQQTWTGLSVLNSAGAITFNSTENLASNTCTDKGDYWIDIYDADIGGTEDISINLDTGDEAVTYTSFMVYIDTVVAGLTTADDYACIAQGWTNGGGTLHWLLFLYNDAGTVKWILYDFENSILNYATSNQPTDGNLYQVQIKWDATGNTQELKINGTSVATNTQSVTAVGSLLIGPSNSFNGYSGAYRIQVDSIKVDNTAYPDSCLE